MEPAMTSPTSARFCHNRGAGAPPAIFAPDATWARRPCHRRAFTLIELLVVIGIIAILAAFAVPAIYKAWKKGTDTKTKADFQVIATGLEAFKSDTGDYPRTEGQNTGFAVLARAMVAPFGNGLDDSAVTPTLDPTDPPAYSATKTYKSGDAVRQPSSLPAAGTVNTYVCLKECAGQAPVAGGNQYWAEVSVNDARDGPGTKVRAGGSNRGPYLQPDRFKMRGCALLDGEGNPILYFAAAPSKPNVHAAGGYVVRGKSPPALYDADDNLELFRIAGQTDTNVLTDIRMLLGDINDNGYIDTGDKSPIVEPYLLWAAGNDGKFGFLPGQKKTDDPTNFEFDVTIRK
jgi:general secretion pathway protein G